MKISESKKLIKSEEGQAMVEFALVLPLLLTILCGIIDFGWLFYNQLNIDNATRQAARQISVSCSSKEYNAVLAEAKDIVTDNVISKNTITDEGSITVVYATADNVEFTTEKDVVNAQTVKVSVKAKMPVLTFVLQAITRDDVKVLNSSSTFKVEKKRTNVTPGP